MNGPADSQRRLERFEAAELTALSDEDVLGIYEALRPERSTADDLGAVAGRLEDSDAPLCSALVREAAEVYARRGLLRLT